MARGGLLISLQASPQRQVLTLSAPSGWAINAVWVERQALLCSGFFTSCTSPAAIVSIIIHINERPAAVSDWPDPQLPAIPFAFIHR